ncbi:MAG TPA: VWA domain-containing protein [Vicinamibacteria bacterium]
MTSKPARAALALPLVAALASAPAPAQERPPAAPSQPAFQPAFPSGVELVTVDAVVVDKQGEAVPGFDKEDFVVTEDGKPQTVTSFEAVTLTTSRRVTDLGSRPSWSTNLARVRLGRTFLVLFDDIHLSPSQAFRAKATVSAFLDNAVADGDTVVLVASSGTAWWSARIPEGREQLLAVVKRLDGRYIPDSSPDRLTEWEAMRIEVYQDQEIAWKVMRRFDSYGVRGQQTNEQGAAPADVRANQYGMMPFVVRQRAEEVYRLATNRNKITLESMGRAIRSLAGIRGRKAMVLVSQGFIYDLQLDEMKEVVDASRRLNVPVYFVDTRGLQALPEAFTAAFGRPIESQDVVAVLADITRDAEGSEAVALDTGGFVVKNSNDLAGGMARVSSESKTYYLLGYNPTNLARDGKFRKIEVSLTPWARSRAKGLQVRARRGYYAPLEGAAAKERKPVPKTRELPEIVRALDSPLDVRDVPLRVNAFAFDESSLDQMNVTVLTEIDVKAVSFREEEGRFKGAVAFVMEAQHRETGEYYRYDQTIEMSLLPETRKRLLETWYQVPREFLLPRGGYQAKVVVKDIATGKMGSVVHEFEVPGGGQLRLTTPILSDAVDRSGGTDAPPKPVLRVRPAFAPSSTLYCQFGVFGAKREETGALMPKVVSSYEIRRSDGQVFRRSTPTEIKPTSVGSLLRLVGIPLAGAIPGDYELVLTVKDELAGTTAEARERFVVEGRPGA